MSTTMFFVYYMLHILRALFGRTDWVVRWGIHRNTMHNNTNDHLVLFYVVWADTIVELEFIITESYVVDNVQVTSMYNLYWHSFYGN